MEEDIHSMGKYYIKTLVSQNSKPKQEKDKIKPEQCVKRQKNSFHHRPVNGTENNKNRPETGIKKTLLPLSGLLGSHNIIKEASPKLTYDTRLRRTI